MVYDFRFSRSLVDFFGGSGFRAKVGYVFIKKAMKEHNADIAGETSGHFFYKKLSYVESSELTMLKILKFVADSGKSIGELIKPFQKYSYSNEINMDISHNPDIKNKINGILKEKYIGVKSEEFDGLTMDSWGAESGKRWWFNLRPSNTESLLRFIVEADTKELMDEKINELMGIIKGPSSA